VGKIDDLTAADRSLMMHQAVSRMKMFGSRISNDDITKINWSSLVRCRRFES